MEASFEVFSSVLTTGAEVGSAAGGAGAEATILFASLNIIYYCDLFHT